MAWLQGARRAPPLRRICKLHRVTSPAREGQRGNSVVARRVVSPLLRRGCDVHGEARARSQNAWRAPAEEWLQGARRALAEVQGLSVVGTGRVKQN